MTNIFDTHAHYASRQFDGDRADLLAALPRVITTSSTCIWRAA